MFPSPNFGERRGGKTPSLIVLHYTAMASFEASCARLCDPGPEVSAHWLIGPDGRSLQLVDEAMRAWHAGAGEWRGEGDVNSRSIGIELQNTGRQPFPEPQMQALAAVLRGIFARWGLGPDAVIGHSDMAPGRKSDPGRRFDWARLAKEGLAVWPDASAEAGDFYQDLRRFGYPDVADDLLLEAFRQRFRPAAEGPLDLIDRKMAASLAIRSAV